MVKCKRNNIMLKGVKKPFISLKVVLVLCQNCIISIISFDPSDVDSIFR